MTMSSRSGPEPISDPEHARQLGARLRAIREQHSWSLRDVQAASEGRFTGSAVGTYERGERAISVQRLAELARLYGVPLERLLPEAPFREGDVDAAGRAAGVAEEAHHRPEKVVIDLVALESHNEPELDAIRRYINAIRLRRGDYNGRMLSVRNTDVWAWAASSSRNAEDVVETLDRLDVLKYV